MTADSSRYAAEALAFPAGQVIFNQGDPGNVMYTVLEGDVEIVLGDRVIDEVQAGSVFGEMALIDASPRSATARARTDCKILPVDEHRFKFMVQETPLFALKVMRIMAERLRRRMQELSS